VDAEYQSSGANEVDLRVGIEVRQLPFEPFRISHIVPIHAGEVLSSAESDGLIEPGDESSSHTIRMDDDSAVLETSGYVSGAVRRTVVDQQQLPVPVRLRKD
jgi:hypothetical protein